MNPSESIWEQLLDAARRAREKAYSPYSRFQVGAAVLAEDGRIFSGCNVENASYGLTICAERAAIFAAVAAGARRLAAVVVYTETGEPTAPCGACRQVINEFGPEAVIRCHCSSGVVLARSLRELLPDAFGGESLRRREDGQITSPAPRPS